MLLSKRCTNKLCQLALSFNICLPLLVLRTSHNAYVPLLLSPLTDARVGGASLGATGGAPLPAAAGPGRRTGAMGVSRLHMCVLAHVRPSSQQVVAAGSRQ